MAKPFKVEPDLPMTADGVIYHLECRRSDLSHKIILVGDPGRVPVVAERFDKGSVTFDHLHREIRIMTGTYKGTRVSCISTGMGTDNVEIVINEIHALFELQVPEMEWSAEPAKVAMIRVGTCGGPQSDVPVGAVAITRHALGMDNTCRYYIDESGLGANLLQAANATPLGRIGVYASQAHPEITQALVAAAEAHAPTRPRVVGATASGSGFYGCQGRTVGRFKGKLAVPNLVDVLGGIRFDDGTGAGPQAGRVVNIEMENSAICCLSSILGYKAGTICAVIATRSGEVRSFATPDQVKGALTDAITIALEAIITVA